MNKKNIEKQSKAGASFLKAFLSGNLLTRQNFMKQLPFIGFLSILAVIYIANRNHAEQLIKKNIQTQKEVRDLRAESISIAAELMQISKYSELIKQIKARNLNLEESEEPAKIIYIEKRNKK